MQKGKDFEILVALIERVLNKNAEIVFDVKLETKKGNLRQIDILIKQRIGRFEYVTIVECKDTKAKVDINTISAFKELVNQVGAHQGIIVSKSGFQKGAIKEMKDERIFLYELADIDTIESDLSLRKINHYEVKHTTSQFTIKFKEKKDINKLVTVQTPLFSSEYNCYMTLLDLGQDYLSKQNNNIARGLHEKIEDPSVETEISSEYNVVISLPNILQFQHGVDITEIVGFEFDTLTTMITVPTIITEKKRYRKTSTNESFASIITGSYKGEGYRFIDFE